MFYSVSTTIEQYCHVDNNAYGSVILSAYFGFQYIFYMYESIQYKVCMSTETVMQIYQKWGVYYTALNNMAPSWVIVSHLHGRGLVIEWCEWILHVLPVS